MHTQRNPKPRINLTQPQAEFLAEVSKTSNFWQSLATQNRNLGGLTSKQLARLDEFMSTSGEQSVAERYNIPQDVPSYLKPKHDRPPTKPTKLSIPLTNFNQVVAKFTTAQESKIKFPSIRLVDTKAVNSFKIAQNRKQSHLCRLYINKKYVGDVDKTTGIFNESRYADKQPNPDILLVLNKLLANLDDEIKAYGAKMDNCSFCDRELTTRESVYWGYGPICAEHYNLPWELPPEEIDPNQFNLDIPE